MLKTYDSTQAAFIDRDAKRYDANTASWVAVNSVKTYDTNEAAWVERLGNYFVFEIANFNCGGSWWSQDNSFYVNVNTQANGTNDVYSLLWEGEGIVNPVFKCTYSQGGSPASNISKVNPTISFYNGNTCIQSRNLYHRTTNSEVTEDITISLTGTVTSIRIESDAFTQVDGSFYVSLENLTINNKPFRFKE